MHRVRQFFERNGLGVGSRIKARVTQQQLFDAGPHQGLAPGDFIWTGGDCHIYSNHTEQVELQLSRTPHPYPVLNIKRKPDSIFDYAYEDFEVLEYEHHPAIKAPVAV